MIGCSCNDFEGDTHVINLANTAGVVAIVAEEL